MLRLPTEIHLQMVGHCLAGCPTRPVGCSAGDPATDEVRHLLPDAERWPPPPSCTPSTRRTCSGPTGTPRARGQSIIGVFHSHTHTDAYPSPTDVDQAPDPAWHYVLVSLRDTHPVVRSYRIVDGRIDEESVVVVTHTLKAG